MQQLRWQRRAIPRLSQNLVDTCDHTDAGIEVVSP